MKKILLLAFATALFATQQTLAIPAYPHPVNYELPDGSEITIRLQGDERVNWAVTLDGFTLLRNSDGFFEYAVLNTFGDLTLSGIQARNETERTVEDKKFLRDVPTDLRYSASQIETRLELRGMMNEFLQKNNEELQRISGTVRIPVILVGFQGKPFTKTREDFDMLFNQLNYTVGGATGSVRDYFRDISYGQLDLQADIFGPYTLPNPINFYDDECCNGGTGSNCSGGSWGNPRIMATQAVDSAYFIGGADFSNYAIGNSNTVNTVHIIFAGNCQAVGASRCNAIWSHAWVLSTTRVYNGKTISRYSCSPEHRSASGSNLTRIGVIAHELGHSLLGWPDFYATNYSGAVDLGDWCLMASGAHNSSGATPSRPCAWAVVNAGWVPEVILETPQQDITLPNPLDEGIVYRINTKTNNEYFLLENRQRTGWDANVPGSGMLIYHVDRTSLSPWNNNTVNNVITRRRNYIKQAGCSATNGCSNPRSTDPWPQPQLGKTEFTDNSVPNSLSWGGVPTEKPITDITHNTTARTVSFRFMATPKSDGAAVDIPTLESKTSNSITVYAVTPPSNGQTVEYAISTSSSATPISLSWQVVTTFGGLWPLEFYYVYARSAENNEFYAGALSISEAIQTSPHVSIRDVEIHGRESLQAWAKNGILYIKGLNIGQIYRIYTISGTLVCQGIAKSDVEETQCIASLASGTYIIQSENKSVKITL
ncbi:MAG: M6 family metalloprotease domain-containing protein [Bacteroidales bacterium]|nr:M6 family metalloprotease domain-containing protein [Bacteroidales bacterium]